MTRLFLSLLPVMLATAAFSADQTGAERTKLPVSAEIVTKGKVDPDTVPIGNVRVTYADGTKDVWTTKGNCSLPRVSGSGVVGWTVCGPETHIAASYTVRPNSTLILCRGGKVIAEIRSGKGFIEEWAFLADPPRIVLVTRAAHGPADIELHDAQNGALIESVKALDENLPDWAKPYHEG